MIPDPTKAFITDKKRLKKLRKQRAKRGWSEYDFWNFHHYHAWMMISVLERFKTGMGHPVDDNIETMGDWWLVLDEMIEGFKAHIEMNEMETFDPKIHKSYNEWEDPLRKKYERGMELFSKYYTTLWD